MGDRDLSDRRTHAGRARGERGHQGLRQEAREGLTQQQGLADLRAKRAHDCRLTKDRALTTIEEAEAFLRDRGLLTLTLDSTLPSLFAACHEEPYDAGKSGFGSWPKTKWKWGAALAERPGVYVTKVHKGKLLYLTQESATVIDPLCREALDEATEGIYGPVAAALVRHLKSAGPSGLDDVKGELQLEAKELRSARDKLEKVGAIVSRAEVAPGEDRGHVHSSTLLRWDQYHTMRRKASPAAALDDLVVLGVRAAVIAQEDDALAWFSWPVTRTTVTRLLATKRLSRPAAGWLSAT